MVSTRGKSSKTQWRSGFYSDSPWTRWKQQNNNNNFKKHIDKENEKHKRCKSKNTQIYFEFVNQISEIHEKKKTKKKVNTLSKSLFILDEISFIKHHIW